MLYMPKKFCYDEEGSKQLERLCIHRTYGTYKVLTSGAYITYVHI